jgi:hypothetical protein
MAYYHLLLWGTGREDEWKVEVVFRKDKRTGFREIMGSIVVSTGQLCLTSYERLTMAAQFQDYELPEPHDRDLLFTVSPGIYSCRVTQLTDPDDERESTEPDFIVELLRSDVPQQSWATVPWSDDFG